MLPSPGFGRLTFQQISNFFCGNSATLLSLRRLSWVREAFRQPRNVLSAAVRTSLWSIASSLAVMQSNFGRHLALRPYMSLA